MRASVIRRAQRIMLGIVLLASLAVGWSLWRATEAEYGPPWLQPLLGPPQTLAGWRIGIVAGHSGNDSGAVCADGLTEVAVNEKVAEEVVRRLARRGATVDLLQEFDQRLGGYQADAFLSIHSDSCEYDLSGFKVATLEGGSAASDALVTCLWQQYEAVTGLKPHPDTITYDMRGYHAFREIAPDTPAAIIEIGFLQGDRDLLTHHPDLVAMGIVKGLECFLAKDE